jgi:hypothetical protein
LRISRGRRDEDGQDQFVAGKAVGGNLAEMGESILNVMAQPALGHLPVG